MMTPAVFDCVASLLFIIPPQCLIVLTGWSYRGEASL